MAVQAGAERRMGAAVKPGPRCTTRGDYIDEGTSSPWATPLPGPFCAVGTPDPEPDYLRKALEEFESTGVNFASRFIPDHALRLRYIEKIRDMSEAILREFREGKVTAEDAAELANRL